MRYRLPVFVVAVCLFAPLLAEATVVLPLGFRQLTDQATVIAHGRIVALSPQWTTGHPGIETLVTIQVTNYLKGDLGAQLTFRVPGGKVGRFRVVTAGAPGFREGEEVIVFLGAVGPAIPTIVGFNQGVYRVTVDQATGGRVVTPPSMADVTVPTTIVRGDPARKPTPLDQFQARVRAMVVGSENGAREPRGRIRDKRVQ